MAEKPTAGELYKAKVVLEADVVAAVEAVLAGRATDQHPLADGYSFSLGRHLSGKLEAERSRVVVDAVRGRPPVPTDRPVTMPPDPADLLVAVVGGEVGGTLEGLGPRQGHGCRIAERARPRKSPTRRTGRG